MTYPFIPGHECAGIVEEVGKAVTRVKPGDAVVVEPAVSCGTCDQCRTGRPHTCRKLLFLGHYGELTGGMAEFALAPERNCVPLPAKMTVGPGRPGRAAVDRPLRGRPAPARCAARPRPSSARARSDCASSWPSRPKRAALSTRPKRSITGSTAAAKAGADWTGNPDREDVAAEIQARESLGLDLVFECCGEQSALDQAVALLKPGGTLVVVGIPLEPRVTFDSSKVRRREIRVQNVRRQNKCLERAVAMIHAGRIKPDFLATHSFSLDQAAKAYETAAARRDGVIKAIVTP